MQPMVAEEHADRGAGLCTSPPAWLLGGITHATMNTETLLAIQEWASNGHECICKAQMYMVYYVDRH